MSTVEDVRRAIDELTPQHREELLVWVDERYSELVDGQLERDLEAGRMDGRIARALAEHRS